MTAQYCQNTNLWYVENGGFVSCEMFLTRSAAIDAAYSLDLSWTV